MEEEVKSKHMIIIILIMLHLYLHTQKGHVACIQALLAAGADPNRGATKPLIAAVVAQQPEALKALLADPRTYVSAEQNRVNVLSLVIGVGALPCLEVLLEDGRFDAAGPMSSLTPSMNCLHVAAMSPYKQAAVLRRLLRATRGRLPVDAASEEDATALAIALKCDWVEGARILVEEGGADPLRRVSQVRVCHGV